MNILLAIALAQDLQERIDALKIDAPWSKIPWKTCLVDAFAEARRDGKPVLVWALGGDPEGRC